MWRIFLMRVMADLANTQRFIRAADNILSKRGRPPLGIWNEAMAFGEWLWEPWKKGDSGRPNCQRIEAFIGSIFLLELLARAKPSVKDMRWLRYDMTAHGISMSHEAIRAMYRLDLFRHLSSPPERWSDADESHRDMTFEEVFVQSVKIALPALRPLLLASKEIRL